MEESFGEYVAATDAIRDILRGYPFSIGLLREILQNSDDAKATKQVFILDHRQHSTENVLDYPYLAKTQGPALLVYNDGLLRDKDWTALREIHRSSKVTDSMKIGKFGLGFRSCYHVTDMPHILSGSHFAILDPHRHFRKDGGVRINIVDNSEQFNDHLSAFDSIFPRSQWGKPYSGTIFRFPLRTAPGEISNKVTSAAEIAELLGSFAREELEVSLLFLRNISTIEICEITGDGERSMLSKASISRSSFEEYGSQYLTRKVTIQVCANGSSDQKEWRVLRAPFSESEALEELSERLEWNTARTKRTLSEDKLNPAVDLAVSCDFSAMTEEGRLFTFLPLPLKTNFPVHINGVFSLTQSRQNLRNAGEVGIVSDSEDRARVEWNRLLFDTYIPHAWAILLEVLVNEDHIPNVFTAWPKEQANVRSGDAMYWKEMPVDVAEHALELDVWPISGTSPPSYQRISSLIVEERSAELEGVVAALVRTGVQITRLPEYLTDIITKNYMSSIQVLSPQIAHAKLRAFITQLRNLDDDDARVILTYLLSTYDCNYIHGLPLVPSVSGRRIALRLTASTSSPSFHVMFDENEETLFGAYDAEAISLQQMAQTARWVIAEYGTELLNVTQLRPPRVTAYLTRSPYASQSWGSAREDQIQWLNLFWQWAKSTEFSLYTGHFFLVPTTTCMQRPTELVFDPENDAAKLTHLLEAFGVAVIDPRFEMSARTALIGLRVTSNIHHLLRALSLPTLRSVDLSERDSSVFCAYLMKHLPRTCEEIGPIDQDHALLSRLRSLPIYPLISISEDGQLTTSRGSIPTSHDIQGVNPVEVPILPHLNNVVYLDLTSVNVQLLKHLNPTLEPLSPTDMHDLMLHFFTSQSPTMQLAFVQYLSELAVPPPRVINCLASTRFMLSSDGTLQAPRHLIDPQSPVAALFSAPSHRLPSLLRPSSAKLSQLLHDFDLFITRLSMDIVKECVRSMSTGRCYDPEGVARCLIRLLNDAHPDIYQSFDPSLLSQNSRWIPTTKGLKSPASCRDFLSHQGKVDLFDEAMPLVSSDVAIGPHLRGIFGWNMEVPAGVVEKQLTEVLKSARSSPETRYRKVFEIVKELGTRSLTDEHLSSLRQTLNAEKWVPTQSGTLEMVEFALLGGDDIPEAGFHSVAFDSIRHSEIRSFLSKMGCIERPTKETIFKHLATLYYNQSTQVTSEQLTHGIIKLLAWLPRLDPDDRSKIFVPDESGLLCPYDAIYFNDVGARAGLHNFESGSLVHPAVSPDLASDLGLLRLGLMGFQDQTDDLNIDWAAAIRTRLEDYGDERLLLDIISVASDACATEVNILLDDAWGPTEALLSPRCEETQRAPTLVIQHNGKFTENDLTQMLRSCGAGSGKKPLIGRYGHGALAIFHVTEFAMIISQDQVWFFNPCKAYISIDKAILRLPLSAVWRSYGDHLAPLNGLFGFSIPEDPAQEFSYNGTIFHLPLRASAHSPDVNPIFTRTTSLQSLTTDLKSRAPRCLLFSSLESISLYDRPRQQQTTSLQSLASDLKFLAPRFLPFSSLELISRPQQQRSVQMMPGPRLQWCVNAVKKDISHSRGEIKAHTVTTSNPMSIQGSHEWRVLAFDAKTMVPPALASLQKHYQFKRSSVVHIAVRLDSNPEPVHSLFSTIPYLTTLDLPVHISGPFILTPDMASIRLDESQGPETCYNRWLLTLVIPILYLRMLEDRALVVDNSPYWPGSSKVAPEDASNDISTLVGDAVYKMALADNSTYTVFRSRFWPLTHPPRIARFVTRIPRAVLAVLEATKPEDIIQLSPTVTRRLQEQNSRHFSLVTPKYLHKQLSDHPEHFSTSTLDRPQLQELIDFLSADSDPLSCLSGLPLLPLDDGTFVQFGPASATTFYAVPTEVLKTGVFKPSRLVHRALDHTKLLAISGLNVKPIDENNIKGLLDDRISPSETLKDADAGTQQWIHSFWQVFPLLKVSTNALLKYPLIPTLKSGHFLSLAFCKKSAILADFSKEAPLRQALAQMGLTVVDTASLSSDLRRALPPSFLVVSAVLANILNRDQTEVTAMFNALDSKTRPAFISWVRKDWQRRRRPYFQKNPGYRASVPIWRVADGSYVSANDVQMLPKSVTVNSIGPFASKTLIGHDLTLAEMGLEPPPVQSLLHIPPQLGEGQDGAYKKLLRDVLFVFTPDNAVVPVPNSWRAIRDSNTMYSSQDDLFVAAFGSNSEYFIHPAFVQFETQLEKRGLKRQDNLDLTMFRACVEAFHNAGGKVNKERRARADVLFWYWGEELPAQLTALNQDQLPSLDDFRFISRNLIPRPLGSENDTKYINQVPAIASPNELVRLEFVDIAWTQRGFYQPGSQPHPDLVKMHPNLSVPTAEEVVKHLVVLATKVAREVDITCRNILLDHLEKTYSWLNKHADDARPFLQKCNADALFLNTEVPQITPMEDWNWKRAEHILLSSDTDREYLQYPRAFIRSFQALLVAAEAVTIDYGKEVKPPVELPANEDRHMNLCSTLNRMRRNGICIDVNFSFGSTDEKPLHAHRTYLAAYSPHFMKLFSEPKTAETRVSVVNVDKSYSRRCVEALLDYVYISQEPDLSNEGKNGVKLAIELLSLAHHWGMSDAQHVMQNMIIRLQMVDPFTLEFIHDAARQTGSQELVDHCEHFAKRNSDLIQRVKKQADNEKRV